MKDINKNVIALGFVSFFTDMASSMITTILPLYIVYVLNIGVDKLGFIVAIATFVSYFFRFIFGYLSDRLQIVKPFVVAGYTISSFTKPLLYFSNGWVSVALLRGLERVGKTVRSATKDTLISAYSKSAKSGKTFGFHKTMDIAGELTGSIIAFLVLMFIGQSEDVFKSIFALTIIPGVLAVIIVIFFVQDVSFNAEREVQKIDLSQDYHLFPIMLLYFGFSFFIFSDSFFILKAKEAGYEMAYIPLLVILLNLAQTLFSYYFGLNIDKYGSKRVLLLSFIFGVLSMALLHCNFIIAAFIALGLYIVASLNAIRALISNSAVNKGSVYGFLYSGTAISSALGASIIGIIWHKFGQVFAINFSIIGLIAISLIFWLVRE